MNYCPVCKREYREMGRNETRQLSCLWHSLIRISDDEMNGVHRENIQKKE